MHPVGHQKANYPVSVIITAAFTSLTVNNSIGKEELDNINILDN